MLTAAKVTEKGLPLWVLEASSRGLANKVVISQASDRSIGWHDSLECGSALKKNLIGWHSISPCILP